MTPQEIRAAFQKALAFLQSGQPDRAEPLLAALLEATQGAAEVHFHLSRVAEMRGETEAQIAALSQALHKKPDEPAVLTAAITAHSRHGDTAEVIALYDRLIALTPKDIGPRADKALYLQNTGDFEGAEKILRRLIRQNPQALELYRMLSTVTKLPRGDALVRQMRAFWPDKRLNDHGRMHLGFALAKVSEDSGQTDKVFAFLRPANAAQGRLAPFDAPARDAEWRAFRAAQDAPDYSSPVAPLPQRPVFVTGLPRSGTTLVEQIIAAHSGARAGGEMGHALSQAVAAFGPATRAKPLASLGAEELGAYAERYTRLVRRDTGSAPGVVTDKSIQSHLVYGYIARALPEARLIVVHRDPRDIALSIYRNHFALGTHRYATDLAAIAETIKRFRENIDWWRPRLGDRLFEIRYEDLVSDPESQARALIAAAGLEWEDACLDFHKARGAVKTLSLAQVRQPIHAGRREAWRKYEADLAPFIAAWGDDPWD